MSLEDVRRQILDENKRRFSAMDYGNDPDVFFTEVVTPLRALRDMGAIDRLAEATMNKGGKSYVAFVHIFGAVNLNLI